MLICERKAHSPTHPPITHPNQPPHTHMCPLPIYCPAPMHALSHHHPSLPRPSAAAGELDSGNRRIFQAGEVVSYNLQVWRTVCN